MKYYRVTINQNVDISGPRTFWLRVTIDNKNVVVGWELTKTGERTHRKHIISRDNATFEPATMNPTYAEMELTK